MILGIERLATGRMFSVSDRFLLQTTAHRVYQAAHSGNHR